MHLNGVLIRARRRGNQRWTADIATLKALRGKGQAARTPARAMR